MTLNTLKCNYFTALGLMQQMCGKAGIKARIRTQCQCQTEHSHRRTAHVRRRLIIYVMHSKSNHCIGKLLLMYQTTGRFRTISNGTCNTWQVLSPINNIKLHQMLRNELYIKVSKKQPKNGIIQVEIIKDTNHSNYNYKLQAADLSQRNHELLRIIQKRHNI